MPRNYASQTSNVDDSLPKLPAIFSLVHFTLTKHRLDLFEIDLICHVLLRALHRSRKTPGMA